MFGYIRVCKPELKIKEFETFRAYYCGLCHTLKREYSSKARLLLSYDCAFLYLLEDALCIEKPGYLKQRCVVHPFRERHTTDGARAEYAAAVNVLLGAESIKDHARDDKKFPYKAWSLMLDKDCEKAAGNYPQAAESVRRGMDELLKIERRQETDIDIAANAFAVMLEGIFAQMDAGNRALSNMGYNIGRWIYIIDALDDFEKDAKSGSYNPFVKKFGKELNDEVRASAEYNLNASVSGAAAAFDLLSIKKHEGIIKNIIYLGLYRKTEEVLKGGKGKSTDGSI